MENTKSRAQNFFFLPSFHNKILNKMTSRPLSVKTTSDTSNTPDEHLMGILLIEAAPAFTFAYAWQEWSEAFNSIDYIYTLYRIRLLFTNDVVQASTYIFNHVTFFKKLPLRH